MIKIEFPQVCFWKKSKKSESFAREIEKEFDVEMGKMVLEDLPLFFPENLQSNYKEDKNHMELSFYLPKDLTQLNLLQKFCIKS